MMMIKMVNVCLISSSKLAGDHRFLAGIMLCDKRN
jgi:hypothetical protein